MSQEITKKKEPKKKSQTVAAAVCLESGDRTGLAATLQAIILKDPGGSLFGADVDPFSTPITTRELESFPKRFQRFLELRGVDSAGQCNPRLARLWRITRHCVLQSIREREEIDVSTASLGILWGIRLLSGETRFTESSGTITTSTASSR